MNYLSTENILFLLAGVCLITASAFAFARQKEGLTMVLLFGGAFFLRMFMISLDPFLNNWDERFHAVVAKHMMDHPFRPTLHDEVSIPYNFRDWTNNNIWLHKQPVFMWQMALSMKIFGVNEIALRLPSALMGALQTVFIYRIGKLLMNRETGLIAAILFSGSYYQLQQTSGLFGMDHNDIAFGFYITASIWCLFEFRNSNKKYWIILIGVAAGLAILNKWLTGLLVYSGWGIAILLDKNSRKSFQSYKQIATAILITCVVFLPWQIYILDHFPVESNYEFSYNSEHIATAVEGHRGANAFYINKFTKEHYGYWAIAPFILGVFFIARKSKLYNSLIILIPVAAVYLFFSFIVKTKISGYVFVVAPLIYISIAAGFYYMFKLLPRRRIIKYAGLLAIVVICYLNFSFNKMISLHYRLVSNVNREVKIANTTVYKQLNEIVPAGYVVFNVPDYEHCDAMFYSDRNAYQWYPSEEEYLYLKQHNTKIAVFKEHHNVKMPDYLKNDPEILMLDFKLY